jgi:hypothetical protein
MFCSRSQDGARLKIWDLNTGLSDSKTQSHANGHWPQATEAPGEWSVETIGR